MPSDNNPSSSTTSNQHDEDDQPHEQPLESNQEERDALLSFQLRGRLSEIKFSTIWKIMPSLKWKYNSNGMRYLAPNGVDLGTAKEAMEQLDFCALEHLRFRNDLDVHAHAHVHAQTAHLGTNAQSINGADNANAGHERDQALLAFQELEIIRKDLLTAIFYKCRESGEPLPSFYFDEVDDEAYDTDDEDEHMDNKPLRVTRPQSSSRTRVVNANRDTGRSATANEKGTEIYLGTKKNINITKKQQQQQSRGIAGEGKLNWPSARDCVEAMKEISQRDGSGVHSQLSTREKCSQYAEQHGAEWKFLLNTNHSLLFHGVGSKKRLLDNFVDSELKMHGDVLALNGYDPNINIAQILDILVTLFLNGVEPSPVPIIQVAAENRECGIGLLRTPNQLTSHVVRRAIAIAKALGDRHPRPIYLVIHNIDGVGLRNEDAQRALSVLVVHSNVANGPKRDEIVVEDRRIVRIAASLDHVDVPILLWDIETMNNYSWIWKEINSHEPYFDEIEIGIKEGTRKIKVSQQEKVDFVFMKKVLKSVAPKHTAILKELAKIQLASGKPNSSLGTFEYVNLKEWKQICFGTAFIVTKDSEFDSMFKELCDHHMVQRIDDTSVGITYVCIPTKKDKVQEILESMMNDT